MEDPECVYDEVRRLVAVSPEKTQYDSKDSVLFVFNKPLLVDGGPYEVEFKGDSHCLRVPAVLLNSCTIQTHAPVYYPPAKTTVTIYDKIKQHDPYIAKCSFEFVSRSQVFADLLDKATDPGELLCDFCGTSTADMEQFDEAMALKIQQKSPHDFHLLDVTQTFPGQTADQTNSRYPTLIHFGAAHGLAQTVAACLLYCPAALQACALKNTDSLCPKEIAQEQGHLELSEDLQDFESHERSNPNNGENDDEYVKMSPSKLEFEDEYPDYVKMAPTPGGKDFHMNPELRKAISIAERAVNEKCRNNHLDEETAKAFRQLIQKIAREHSDKSSPIYDFPSGQKSAPALPPKTYPLNNKRHSIHDIPISGPPLPPRSPLSPRSPKFFTGVEGPVPGDRYGSDPNIFHRMQQNFDKRRSYEETTSQRLEIADQPPELPARARSPLPFRALRSIVNERRGSDPNLSFRRPHCTEKQSLTLPLKPPQVMNGSHPHDDQPDMPNGFLRHKSNSLDATSMGLSPRLLPRQPRPAPRSPHRQRTLSCETAVPTQNGLRSRIPCTTPSFK